MPGGGPSSSERLAGTAEGNLSPKQPEFAQTIHAAGSDLLARINDILDMERRLEEERRRAVEERVPVTLRIAREIQQKFFPAAPPSCLGFEIGGMSRPAELTGGDAFDYIPLPGGGVGVAVGDVRGHGVGPALLMATTRAYSPVLALTNARVGDILTNALGLGQAWDNPLQ